MKATIVELESLFSGQVSFQIPQFQRPYAWEEEDQWMPLWEDVRAVAEQYVDEEDEEEVRPHFMGAIVLQHRQSPTGEVTKRLVIDGQQRLTTLQLLIRATQLVFLGINDTLRADRLRSLIENLDSHLGGDPYANKPKIRQSNRNDQSSFHQAMTRHATNAEYVREPILDALNFFQDRVDSWLKEGAIERISRSNALENTLLRQLKIAVIDLDQKDKPHFIFETLNARGEPLRQSDLVKNTVMYEADVVDDAYAAERLWGMFELKWWRTSTGEPRVDRIQLDRFLNHWMVMKIRREVSHQRVAAVFREFCANNATKEIELIAEDIRTTGNIYKNMLEAVDTDDEIELFLSRMKTMDIATAMPLLLWLKTSKASNEQIKQCYRIIESYLVRRMLCGLISHGMGGVFANLIDKMHSEPPSKYSDIILNQLRSYSANSTIWPSDRLVSDILNNQPMPVSAPRQKMVLEAIELYLTNEKFEPLFNTKKLTVEHIMPKKWDRHWPIHPNNSNQELNDRRDLSVKMLGNLTLTTNKLNSSMSNAPWKEKSMELDKHTRLFLTRSLLEQFDEWNEETILKRTSDLTEFITDIWKPADRFSHTQ